MAAIVKRYEDGYAVATQIAGASKIIGYLGCFLSLLLFFAVVILGYAALATPTYPPSGWWATATSQSFPFHVSVWVTAIILTVLSLIATGLLATFVGAIGQFALAVVDTAVNTSLLLQEQVNPAAFYMPQVGDR